MTTPPFDTEKPPAIKVTDAHYHEGQLFSASVKLDFSANPAVGQPFMDFLREWLRNGDAWEQFGTWYDSGNYSTYESGTG